MIKRFTSRSRVYRSTSFNNTMIGAKYIKSPLFEHHHNGYLVRVNLGTFPGEKSHYKTYYLKFTTASDLTWLQCEDCASPDGFCFPQIDPPYPNGRSTSYVLVDYDKSELCYPYQHNGQYCTYAKTYIDGSHSFGNLANEIFKLGTKSFPMVFGCGFNNKLQGFKDYSKSAGHLGMGLGPRSLINQQYSFTLGRFSYCLPPLLHFNGHTQPSSHILFGKLTHGRRNLPNTPIYEHSNELSYFVNLVDISINNQRLNIPSESFRRTRHNDGGCIIDIGTPYTHISQSAYNILKDAMIHHLAMKDSRLMLRIPLNPFDLCFFRLPPFEGYNHLPNVTFHFEGGADLVHQRDVAFILQHEYGMELICMSIVPNPHNNIAIIGAHSQANHVILFDLRRRKLYMGPQDCAQDRPKKRAVGAPHMTHQP